MRPLALFLALAGLALAQDPLPVTFLPGGAGAEGCYQQWSTRSAVRAYSAPTRLSAHLRTVDADRRIDANDYSESLTAVLQPGLVRARQPLAIEGYRLGTESSETVQLSLNDELQILGGAGEGSLYFAFGPAVYAGFVPGYYGEEEVEVVRQPVTELWVRLVEHGPDRPAAWVNTAQAGMAERETFCE